MVFPKSTTCAKHWVKDLTMDAQVEQAKNNYQSILPDAEFLTMSQEMDNIVKEQSRRFDEEKDEEHMVYGFGECNEHDRSRLSLRKSGREGIRH